MVRKVLVMMDFPSTMKVIAETSTQKAVNAAKAVEVDGLSPTTIRVDAKTKAFFEAYGKEAGISMQVAMAMCLDAIVEKTL